VAAHQDDIEILAYDGICDCLESPATRALNLFSRSKWKAMSVLRIMLMMADRA
jgi:hypothetical protein